MEAAAGRSDPQRIGPEYGLHFYFHSSAQFVDGDGYRCGPCLALAGVGRNRGLASSLAKCLLSSVTFRLGVFCYVRYSTYGTTKLSLYVERVGVTRWLQAIKGFPNSRQSTIRASRFACVARTPILSLSDRTTTSARLLEASVWIGPWKQKGPSIR